VKRQQGVLLTITLLLCTWWVFIWHHRHGDDAHRGFQRIVLRRAYDVAGEACEKYRTGGETAVRQVSSDLYWCRVGLDDVPQRPPPYHQVLYLLPKLRAYQPSWPVRVLLLDFHEYAVPAFMFSLETESEIWNNGFKPCPPSWRPRDELPPRLWE
jgi:hypothetical protein